MEYHDLIRLSLIALSERQAAYATWRKYYAGQHEMRYATQKFRERYGQLFSQFADNLCPIVIDANADRLILDGVDDAATGQSDADVQQVFERNRFDSLQQFVHAECLLMGDAYLLLWPRDTQVGIRRQRAELIAPIFDPDEPSTLLCAAKFWRTHEHHHRLTIYYADRCERWIRKTGTTSNNANAAPQADSSSIPADLRQAFVLYSDGEAAVQRHNFGQVPLVHFANRADVGEFGRSELVPARAIQDGLNKSCFDALVNSEHTSMAQRFVLGVDVEYDKEGRPINPFEGKGLWTLANQDATVGQLEAGNAEHMLLATNDWRVEMARVTMTPSYYFQLGSVPSGEALKMVEAPFAAKIRKQQQLFGDRWEDAIAIALGRDVTSLGAVWRDTTPRTELERVLAAEARSRIGVPNSQLQIELGYSPEQAQQFGDEAQQQAEERARLNFVAFARGG